MLSAITFLDLSYCTNVGGRALAAIGRNCKSLTTLIRVTYPLQVVDRPSQDDEALAIALTMPKLKHLEIRYLLVKTSVVIEIINRCGNLELLDIQGCCIEDLEENFVKRFPKLKVVGPRVEDRVYLDGWEILSDNSDYSYKPGDLALEYSESDEYHDHEEILDDDLSEDENHIVDVELRSYDDINADYDWRHSP